MTLTKFMARSTWVAYAFERGKLLKCHLKGKASRKLTNGQIILINLKKENGPRASSAPALGLNTILFKHVYWYMQQISGERLQDHWSSGSLMLRLILAIFSSVQPVKQPSPLINIFGVLTSVLFQFRVTNLATSC